MSDILTPRDLTDLIMISHAVESKARIAWTPDEGETIREGQARSIGDEHGNFLIPSGDIRDGYLRVTSPTGFDYFLPMREVMKWNREGAFTTRA